MTNFDTMDKLNTSFVPLSDQELMETDGGVIDPFTWGLIAGGVVVLAATGYSIWKSSK